METNRNIIATVANTAATHTITICASGLDFKVTRVRGPGPVFQLSATHIFESFALAVIHVRHTSRNYTSKITCVPRYNEALVLAWDRPEIVNSSLGCF